LDKGWIQDGQRRGWTKVGQRVEKGWVEGGYKDEGWRKVGKRLDKGWIKGG